jgi:hypothetical protein
VEVRRFILSRAQLAAMPEAERVVLLLLAHASNEINVLTKLIMAQRRDDLPSPIHDAVEGGQAFILMRLLIGKLHEAWELFKNRVQGNRSIATTYLPRLGAEPAAALEALNRHFGAGSVLSAIRNKVSFHYSDKENLTEASFQQLAQDEPLQFYMTKTAGNSFYHAAELITQLAAISLVRLPPPDPNERARIAQLVDPINPPPADPNDSALAAARALAALCDEIKAVSEHITELFGHLIAMLIAENIVGHIVTEQVPDGPKLSTFFLPYFFDENDVSLITATVPSE